MSQKLFLGKTASSSGDDRVSARSCGLITCPTRRNEERVAACSNLGTVEAEHLVSSHVLCGSSFRCSAPDEGRDIYIGLDSTLLDYELELILIIASQETNCLIHLRSKPK